MKRTRHRGMAAAATLLAGLTACGGGDADESLREGLEGLGSDTVVATAPPADTLPRPSESVPAPLPEAPTDTQPWVPEERALAPSEWTVRSVAARRPGVTMATQRGVRLGRQPDFVRIVLDFADGPLPGYQVEYVDEPVSQCGSGDQIKLEGDALLYLRLTPAQAHDDQGRVTVQQRHVRPANLPVVEEMRLVCDFEGEVAWAIGVASPNAYRVLELANPARLVVDIRNE